MKTLLVQNRGVTRETSIQARKANSRPTTHRSDAKTFSSFPPLSLSSNLPEMMSRIAVNALKSTNKSRVKLIPSRSCAADPRLPSSPSQDSNRTSSVRSLPHVRFKPRRRPLFTQPPVLGDFRITDKQMLHQLCTRLFGFVRMPCDGPGQ